MAGKLEDVLERRVIARDGVTSREIGRGLVVAVTDEPQCLIKRVDGTQFMWAASLCELDTGNGTGGRADAQRR